MSAVFHRPGNHTAETALAGATGFEPPSCETTSFQLHAHAGAFPRFSARNPMPRERPPQRRGCAQKGRPLFGGRGGPTGACGKRIHGATWHIGEAGAALPTVRSLALPESDDTGRTGGVIGGSDSPPGTSAIGASPAAAVTKLDGAV
jgi:hypothetical protein